MDFDVWSKLETIIDLFESEFSKTGNETFEDHMQRFNKPNWINKTWESNLYRRAHLEIVDARDDKGLWVMHCCVFPHFHNNGPIFGLDIIAGKKKITGFFHDYSPTAISDHYMIDRFGSFVDNFKWNKNRELPDWAKQIFTKHMVAAGNISTENEVMQIIDMCKESMGLYLNDIGLSNHTETGKQSLDGYNRYASFQKQNPHTPRALKSLGLDPTDVDFFVDQCLFPEM